MPDGLGGKEQAIYFSKVRKFFESYACSRVMGRRKKMSDYIRREDAVDAVCAEWCGNAHDAHCDACAEVHRINDLPSADVAPVVHSEWIYHMSFGVCKKCGYEYEWKGTDAKNYCPNCGAKMDKE